MGQVHRAKEHAHFLRRGGDPHHKHGSVDHDGQHGDNRCREGEHQHIIAGKAAVHQHGLHQVPAPLAEHLQIALHPTGTLHDGLF